MANGLPDKNTKAELLAPAGSKESFYAAMNSGADAVYMAASSFGARAYADNFSDEDIIECSEYAHIYGKKIYLTVNTLLKDQEFEELERMYERGIFEAADGLIIQDLGVAEFFKNKNPLIPLHASTQMSVTGVNAVRLLMDYGFSRVVPARELSLKQIREIYDKTGAEIECFIHGSMCYSYSGQCLFSSILGSRSGNRGRCAQPCRLPYSLKGLDNKACYPLSLKDMCTLKILPEIIEAGAVSLKVEGRMKPPGYVSGVISIYRKYLDMYYSGNEYRVEESDINKLSSLYVRGSFSNGYYKMHNSRDMITFDSHGYNQYAENPQDDKAVNALKDSAEKNEYDSKYALKKIKVSFKVDFICGEKACIIASSTDINGAEKSAYIEGDIVETARSRAISEDDIKKSLKKLGGTVFEASDENITINLSDKAFYSLKGINELRRAVTNKLTEDLKNPTTINNGSFSCKYENFCKKYYYRNVTNSGFWGNSLLISTSQQARALAFLYENEAINNLKNLYISEEIQDIDFLKFIKMQDKDVKILAAMSFIRQGKDVPDSVINLLSEKILDGVLVRNLDDLSFFASSDFRKDICLFSDFGLYAFNSHSALFYDKICDRVTLPLEMSFNEEKALRKKTGLQFEKVIYGHAPLMITANCVRKTFRSCTKKGGFETLIDRKDAEFPVKTDCKNCLNIIYNSVPLSFKKDKQPSPYRIELSVEDYDESLKILRYYFSGGECPDIKHTTGWHTRPVI